MERKKASDYPQELLDLFHLYVHGDIDRRAFLEGAQKFAVGGLTATAIWESLRPNYAWAEQIPKDDKRIKVESVTISSSQGNGTINGYFVKPANATGKLPGVLVVHENRGRMAVERGPIVYCCEWPDAPGAGILNLLFDAKAELTPSWDKDLFGGATVIQTAARSISDPASAPKAVHMIPYHLWANRGPGEMTVWLSTEEYRIGDTGPAGGIIFFKNPNYATDGWRYLEAAPLDQSGGAKWGCFRTAIPGARGTAIGTGRQNTLDMVAACAEPGSAARLCTDLSINGIRGWFLPSEGELDLMYRNLAANGLSFAILGPDNVNYWTSTQQTADMAAHIDFADNGRHHGDDKDFPRRVRAIRAF